MRNLLIVTASLGLLFHGGCGRASETQEAKFLTQNLYYGTEFDDAIAALVAGDEPEFVLQVTLAWGRVQATDFPTRAAALAEEIARVGPDLIGLQEAALWRVQSPADPATPATDVVYDFVQILIDALAARGLDYEVAAVFAGLDVEFPYLNESFDLDEVRLTDREVILARRDGALRWDNAETTAFGANLPLPGGIEVRRGFASVEAELDGHRFRFLSTHLEADDAGVRALQADELLQVVSTSSLPVVLVGDFNYDLGSADPEATAFAQAFAAAGLSVAAPSSPTALTCCADALLTDPLAVFTERLDLVLHGAGFTVVREEVLGSTAAEMSGGLWPSDHAAVAATLTLP